MMLKKIYQELVLIRQELLLARKELQAIRSSMEAIPKIKIDEKGVYESIRKDFFKAFRNDALKVGIEAQTASERACKNYTY